MKKNQVCFSIVPRGPSVGGNDWLAKDSNDWVTIDSDSRVLVEITELLNEYKDIVADDIPDGLPLVRSIRHCMDLIPRASFPNKEPYRLTPIENEELTRQVHELL